MLQPSKSAEIVRIEIDPEQRHQTIEGFGCSINAWTAPHYALYYDDAFTDFAVEELGLSVFRLQMWGGVTPAEVPDWREIRHQEFRWTGEGLRGKMNVDWAKRIVARNPEVKIIGSVWSAPAWMKENASRTGTRSGYLLDPKRDFDHDNRLRVDRYQHFAKWIVEWARYMEAQGTPFFALSLQNELMFTQWFESTLYTPSEYARIVETTGAMFEAEGVRKPLFFGPEDMTLANYDDAVRHRPYVDALLESDAARYFDALATHGYSDGVRSDAHNDAVAYWRSVAHLGKPYWITEGGSGEHAWPEPVLTGIAPRLHLALVGANVSLFTGWQLASNEGKASEHEFMDWKTPTAKTYATMHFWRHVRPGAVRVEASVPESAGLLASAFTHERRGESVVVLINRTSRPLTAEVHWPGIERWIAYRTDETLRHAPIDDSSATEPNGRFVLPGPSIVTAIGRKQP
ncbi:hypothetical protein ASA1KI_31820 [Opitutales bacterium ASA1]|nr:hypothetical protein ASA1KI_31820 [Opitutales bacterium ASA1]